MREPTREERAQTPPPGLRMSSKTTQAYFDMRRKILLGEYSAHQVLIPKQIEESSQINNTSHPFRLFNAYPDGSACYCGSWFCK